MANGMGSLYIGASGLHNAQTALNTTAHNLANIDTKGYTRQQITAKDATYLNVGTRAVQQGKYGLGVRVDEIRRIRDEFIDKAYRSENSRLGYYNSHYNAVQEVEDLLGEMQGVTYQQCLTNLYTAVNELSKNPASTVARSSLIQYSSAFVNRSNKIYESLKDYQATLNTEVANKINRINELGHEIFELNIKIQGIESGSGEYANDLRDQRDNDLDELSGYIKMTYYEEPTGKVIVNCENTPFVGENLVNEMGSRAQQGTNLLIPTWPSFNRDVYDITKKVSNGDNTDKGSLKGTIIARGCVSADATVIPVKPDSADYDMTTAEGMASYNEAMEAYQVKQDYYNTYIEPSAILSALAGLDKLVNGIVEGTNDILCPETEITSNTRLVDDNGKNLTADSFIYTSTQATLYSIGGVEVQGVANAAGTAYTYNTDVQLYADEDCTTEVAADQYTYHMLDLTKTDYGTDDNKTVGAELFSRVNTERYAKITNPDGTTTYIRNNIDLKGNPSRYTIGNLMINKEVAQNVGVLALSTETGKEDFARAQELLDLWTDKFASLNPEVYAKADYNTYYTNFISEYATIGQVLDNFTSNQQVMVDGYNDQRLQIEGVSSDEELQKMIKFQQAYNAASRYVNVVNQMIEHLVTSLAGR